MARAPQQQPQQRFQVVRLLGTDEQKQVETHTDQVDGGERVVYWNDIKEQFPYIKLAIAGLDFQRDSNGLILMPQRIKAQHPSEIIVQREGDPVADAEEILRVLKENHAENMAQHGKSQAKIDDLLLNVKSGIRALFDLPNHSIPRLFIVVPDTTSKYNPSKMIYRSYRLFFLCECGDSVAAAASTIDGGVSHKMHFAHHEGYEVRTPRKFIQKYGKHMMRLLEAIQTLATIGGTVFPAIFNASKLPTDIQKALRATDDNCLRGIKYISNHLQEVLKATDDTIDTKHCQILDGLDLRAVESFLIRKDENQTLGNLHRILTPDYKIKWVCDQHVKENARVSNMGALQHAIRTFGGTLDEKRGLVTVRLSSGNAEKFFKLIGEDSLIQELDITLDFGPSTDQIRTLRQHMKFSQVSSLSFNIDIPDGNYVFLGVIRKVAGVAQILKLLELKKVGKPGPFRNLSIKGVSDVLEAYEYNKCLAHSLTLDRVSFRWENEKSRQRLLRLLDKAPDLSRLRLCSSTVMQGYNMARKLAETSPQLKTIEIDTQREERIEFDLKGGSIETMAAIVHASELGVVAAWMDRVERLTVMAVDGDWPWPALESIISQSRCLSRLDLHCPVNRFCSIFQQVKDAVGTWSSLETLCLHHGESELLTEDINSSATTTTIKMLPGEERRLGFWNTFSLFGLVPAYDASPSQLTDKQFMALQDHFSQTSGTMRLRELNLDVSKLSCIGLMRLSGFLDQYKVVCLRLSGTWTRNCNDYILSSLGARLTGFDMVAHLAGTNPLENGAPALFEILDFVHKTVSIPGARLKFMTDKGNVIDIPDVRNPKIGYFNIVQEDELFDFALTRYFSQLPPKLLCNNFSDKDAALLRDLIAHVPRRLQYLSISIHGLSPQTLHDLEETISQLSTEAELKIHWNGSEPLSKTKMQTRLHFIFKVANRTRELVLEDISSLGDSVSDAPPSWPVLRSVSLRNIQTSGWFTTWMRWMVTSEKLEFVCFVGLLNIDHLQWSDIMTVMTFPTLKSVRVESSRLPANLLKVIVDRIPQAGACLTTLYVECHETPKKTWYGKKKKPASRIPFESGVLGKAPKCVVTKMRPMKGEIQELRANQKSSHHDLTQVALVNKSWSVAANTLIWRTIQLLSISQANIYLNGQDTHKRHLHHVETFQTRLLGAYEFWTRPVSSPCEMAELREERGKAHGSIPEDERGVYFDDDVFGDKATLMQNQEQPLLELLRKNSQLETFKLAMLPDDPQSFLIELAPLLPQLKHIELFRCSRRFKPLINIEVIDAFLRNTSSQLQLATLNFIGFCRQDEGITELLEPLMESGQNKKHPSLKLLRLLDRMDNNLATAFVSFLQGCSSNLRMIETKTEPPPNSSDDLGWDGPTPVFRSTLEEVSGCRIATFRDTSLYLFTDDTPEETDEWIAKTISTFKDSGDSKGYWQTINLANTAASSLTAKAITDCCHEGLTALSLARCQGIPSEDIKSILSKAVNLRHLECNAPGEDGYSPDPVLLASHVLQSTWACTWLVRLNIHIGGIPRPDIKCNEAGTPVKVAGEPLDNCTVEESHTLQRKIYRQLGQLHLLEELFLGYTCSFTLNENIGYEADKAQRSCLEMTLKSGLDESRELKCLRVLAVAFMAHRIEVLDWMQKNWPDFHTMLGIMLRTYPEDKSRGGLQSA
ncbi:hypothetical protein BG015_011181 [Linnemannia schmuckeri]|uniref:Uncharacterized protein n=1 Tax=Linnemannia schmuckeri TaxID=64567 RepID=A0A9P5RWI0_9FUNG|nr:hypothetical protein BG015_011181 [Linnemannia schmuckeri]